MRIKTIFMGTPDFAVPILETLLKNTDVVLVVTQPDKEVGRKKILTASPVKKLALAHNIPVYAPAKIRTDYAEILKYQPDLIVTCAYGQIIPTPILNLPRLGCINIHASLLPKYRGGAPIHHALINGEEETGITLMYMDEKMDTGDIIAVSKTRIKDTDTVATLHDRLSKIGSKLLEKTLPVIINGTNSRQKQNDEQATYAKIITREDEHLDFNTPGLQVFNKVRGLNSWPLANLILNGEEIKILAGYLGEKTSAKPGTIVKITKDAIGISTLDRIYYITELKPFGRKVMSAKDYLNGKKSADLLNVTVS